MDATHGSVQRAPEISEKPKEHAAMRHGDVASTAPPSSLGRWSPGPQASSSTDGAVHCRRRTCRARRACRSARPRRHQHVALSCGASKSQRPTGTKRAKLGCRWYQLQGHRADRLLSRVCVRICTRAHGSPCCANHPRHQTAARQPRRGLCSGGRSRRSSRTARPRDTMVATWPRCSARARRSDWSASRRAGCASD